MRRFKKRAAANLTLPLSTLMPSDGRAEQVGNVDVDWLGNDIVVEAFNDPKVSGVTCHISYFERGLIDRSGSQRREVSYQIDRRYRVGGRAGAERNRP